MTQKIRSLLQYFNANPRKLFLLDCGGALLTAFLTGVILPNFEDSIGMPRFVCYDFLPVSFVYAAYSLACYFFAGRRWPFFMKHLVHLNLLYTCFTLEMVDLFYDKLTVLGLLYYSAEVLVLSLVIGAEWGMVFKARRSKSLDMKKQMFTLRPL